MEESSSSESSSASERLNREEKFVKEFKETAEKDSRLMYLYNEEKQAHVFLIGSLHKGALFANLIDHLIRQVKPDTVVVELDEQRGMTLRGNRSPVFAVMENSFFLPERFHKLFHTHRKIAIWIYVYLLYFSRLKTYATLALGEEGGYGQDQYMAMVAAESIGAQIIWGDRSQTATLSRAFGNLKDLLQTQNLPLTEKEQQKSELRKILNKMRQNSSTLDMLPALGPERDVILIHSLRNAPGRKIVGVVGLGHLDGIQRFWDKEEERRVELGMKESELKVKASKRGWRRKYEEDE